MVVVYFDQCLGAAQTKKWSKYALSTFFSAKKLKKEENARNLTK